jgi:hypothetical protein
MRAAMFGRSAGYVLVLTTAVLAAGCGNSSHRAATSAASRSLTSSQAVVIAKTISLAPADVPGYAAMPNHALRSALAGPELAACIGGMDPSEIVADVPSDSFSRGSGLQVEYLESIVTVLPSASLAARSLAVIGSAKAPSCLTKDLASDADLSSTSTLTYATPSVTRIPTPPGAAGGSYGYRIVSAATAAGKTIPTDLDLLEFRSGVFETALIAARIGQPFPRGVETHLYSLLVSRANAYRAARTVITATDNQPVAPVQHGDYSPAVVAHATAIAGVVNLTPADLPGYTSKPRSLTRAVEQLDAEAAACVGGVDPARAVVTAISDAFLRPLKSGGEALSSAVVVFPSASLAAHDLAAAEDARAPSCDVKSFLQYLTRGSPSTVRYGSPLFSRIPTPPSATDGSLGYRIVTPVMEHGAHFPEYYDALVSRLGSVLIELSVTRYRQPFPTSEETRLYRLLVSRARAHRP